MRCCNHCGKFDVDERHDCGSKMKAKDKVPLEIVFTIMQKPEPGLVYDMAKCTPRIFTAPHLSEFHWIEKSAYEKLKAERDKLHAALGFAQADAHNQREALKGLVPSAKLVAQLAVAKEALESIAHDLLSRPDGKWGYECSGTAKRALAKLEEK